MKKGLEKVEVLAPRDGAASLEAFLGSKELLGGRPFDEKRLRSASQLSQAILQDALLKSDPSCVALGYWLRAANLAKLRERFEAQQKLEPETLFVPAGKVFHVAPANVDTLFVYSWALSFLCGNANLVRLSTKPSRIVQGLLGAISKQMESDELLARSNRFVTYEHDAAASEALSLWCTHRIVWGGDETAKAFRAVPLSPHASERSFASKFSYAVIAVEKWLEASAAQKAKLAAAFFNDAFWFDQMACSSPQVIFWLGGRDRMKPALASFEETLEAELRSRKHETDASASMKRLSFAFGLAAQSAVAVRLHEGSFVSIEQMDRRELSKEICGGGAFRHAHAGAISQIAEFAGQEDQTVTHFGLSPEQVRELALDLGSRGVDRVVPIGEALAFEPNWDGFSLVQDFLRRVVVRP